MIIDYELLKKIYKELGEEKFFNIFKETFERFELFTMSKDWLNDNNYILKFKGIYGDIVVNWSSK